MIFEILLIIPVLLVSFYCWYIKNFSYWQNKNIPSSQPSFPFGNIKDVMLVKTTIGDFLQKIYDENSNANVVGFYAFRRPMLVITNPDLAKDVLVKHFNSFSEGGMKQFENVDPIFALNPFFLTGQRWKKFRGILTQAHTVSKIKTMVSSMCTVQKNVHKYILENRDKELNINELTVSFAVDTVVACAYGEKSDSFFDPNNPFSDRSVKQVFIDSNMSALTGIFAPWLTKTLGIRTLSKTAEDLFNDLTSSVMQHRRQSKIVLNDLVQQLINLEQKNITEGIKPLSPMENTAILMAFYLDGTHTFAIVCSSVLFEIAAHPEIQEKLREEIQSAGREIEDFYYDKIWSLQYLEMVVTEALRLHPVISTLIRICTSDTQIGDCLIEKGTAVFIPINAFHFDPRYYPNPKENIPERFSKDNKNSLHKFTYLPFGDGPRTCVGMRYAQTQMRLAVISTLLKFKITLGSKHKTKSLVHDENSSFLVIPKGDIWLKFQPL